MSKDFGLYFQTSPNIISLIGSILYILSYVLLFHLALHREDIYLLVQIVLTHFLKSLVVPPKSGICHK